MSSSLVDKLEKIPPSYWWIHERRLCSILGLDHEISDGKVHPTKYIVNMVNAFINSNIGGVSSSSDRASHIDGDIIILLQ